ncbi:MAG: carboxypeptidase-like regulatory domain-containing protein [Acidobacteriota bacterium]
MRSVAVCLAVLSLAGLSLLAQAQQYALPQVGNGIYAGGSIRTTFILFNPTNSAIDATIRLRNDAGGPMLVTIPSVGTTDVFGPFTLQKGETKMLQTDGSEALSVGSAVVDTNGPLGVSAVFSLYDAQKTFLTEAGVGSAEATTDFVIPVHVAEGFNTGLALVNLGQADANITYRLVNSEGQVVNTSTATLGPGRHLARFVAGPQELFPEVSSFQGSLQVTSTQNLAAVTLRQNAAPLSYTTLPVVPKASTTTSFNLPQVANGIDPAMNLSMRTTFVLFNLAESPANLDFTVRKPDGTPFPLTISGKGANQGTFSHTLPAGGAAFLQTDGTGPLSVGSAQVSSSVPVGVSAIFTVYSADSFLTETGVGNAPTRTDFTLPVDQTASFSTGVAFFNPGDAPVTVSVRLLDLAGNRLAESIPLELAPKSQTARFVWELFSGQTGTAGSLAVRSSGEIAAVTLRQNFPPLNYTTLPVVTGTSNGTLPPGTPLVSQTRPDVNATSNLTLDAQLDPGFKITGVLSGRITSAEQVVAENNAGKAFVGAIDHTTGHYQIVVPPGVYKLSLCYQPRKVGALNLPYVAYTDPNPVNVNSDVVRNLPLPDISLQRVHGTVAGFDQLPANGGVSVLFHDQTSGASLVAPLAPDGTYEGHLPNGTYTVTLLVSNMTVPAQQQFAVYGASPTPITVEGGVVGASFAIPGWSTVRGKVRVADLSPAPASTLVSVVDRQALLPTVDSCSSGLAVQNLAATDAAGNYQMILVNGRSYDMALAIPYGNGTLSYQTVRAVDNLGADRLEDFLLPVLPSPVTISGRVTNPDGQGLKGVTVTAETGQLGNAPGLGFSSSAVTDDAGNYVLTVLGGTAYTVSFAPAP